MKRRRRVQQSVMVGSLLVAAACAPAAESGRIDHPAADPAAALPGMEPLPAISADIGGGIRLGYVEHGTGTPVVLIHGSLADHSYWEQSGQVAALGNQYRVIAYSRRYNHPNRNVPSGNHSPMVEAADLGLFLDVLGIGPVHLVGHSYGAYTALIFAIEQPSRVLSLVLAEPPIISWLPDIPGGEGVLEGFMANVWEPLALAFHEGGDAGGLDFTARWYFGVPFDEVEPAWQTLFLNNVSEWRALAVSPQTFPKLDYDSVRGLRVPTLLISGGNNAGGFNDLVDGRLEQLIPGAERVVIPDASHEMFLDFPEITAGLMTTHFARHGGIRR